MKMKSAAIALTATLVGCTLTNPGLRKESPIPQIGGGEVLAPRRTVLRIMVAKRPVGDAPLSDSVWQLADEQAIDAETRRALQMNGLRVGRVSSELPDDVRAVLSAPPPDHVQAQSVVLPDGDHTLIDPGTPIRPTLNLFLGQNDKLVGKDFQDPHGRIRVTASYEGEDGVSLRITPEIHHGPMRQGWGVAGGNTPMSPQQIVARNGQEEETFRDLACSLVLKPGQIAVLGGNPEKRGSLGDFLFDEPEGDDDRRMQKVIFVWASRSEAGTPDIDPPAGLVPVELPVETSTVK